MSEYPDRSLLPHISESDHSENQIPSYAMIRPNLRFAEWFAAPRYAVQIYRFIFNEHQIVAEHKTATVDGDVFLKTNGNILGHIRYRRGTSGGTAAALSGYFAAVVAQTDGYWSVCEGLCYRRGSNGR